MNLVTFPEEILTAKRFCVVLERALSMKYLTHI